MAVNPWDYESVIGSLKGIDASMMHKVYDCWPDMAEEAFESKTDEVDYAGRHIIFAGMGGSGTISDTLASLLSNTPVHTDVVKGYVLPNTAGPDSLVVATSISGNTLETMALLKAAHEAKCQCIAFSDGGKIEEYCKSNRLEHRRVKRAHSPRASFASYAFSMLRALLPVIPVEKPDVQEAYRKMREIQASICTTSAERNPAIDLARWLPNIPVIYYPFGLRPAAVRFKNSLHENAKMHATADDVIEACHNSIVPWHAHAGAGPVFIRGDHDHPDTQKRWDILGKLLDSRSISYREVFAVSGGILAKLTCLIYMLDYCSIYKAALSKIDPGPIEAIDYIKKMY